MGWNKHNPPQVSKGALPFLMVLSIMSALPMLSMVIRRIVSITVFELVGNMSLARQGTVGFKGPKQGSQQGLAMASFLD